MHRLCFCLLLLSCGDAPIEDPCGELVSCVYDVIAGCDDPAFGDDCVSLSLEPACGEIRRECEDHRSTTSL